MAVLSSLQSAIRRLLPAAQGGTAPVLFEDAVASYFESLAGTGLTERTLANKRAAHLHLVPAFKGRPVEGIRPWEIARVIQAVHELGLHVTSRHVLHEARAIFNVALVNGVVDLNPALHVKPLPAPVRRVRLTLAQYQAIYDYAKQHAPPWFAPCLRLALVTGQRRADLVALTRSDVREDHLFVLQQKTGARVAIPLALRLDAIGCTVGEVIEECLQCKPLDGGWLLRSAARPHRKLHPQTVTHRFWLAQQAAVKHSGPGTPPSFHELRSLSARLYRAQGVDTQTLLGHAKASMTEIYEDDRGLGRAHWKYVALPAGDTLTA